MAASGASKGDIGCFEERSTLGQMLPKSTPLQNSTRTSKQMSPSSSSKIKLVKSRNNQRQARIYNAEEQFQQPDRVFPNVIIANWMGKSEMELFVMDDLDQKRPSFEFN